MLAATLAALAIVAHDGAPLRAGPRESQPQQAVLWQGDALEIRGQRLDYLQVYDHRRERAGFVHISQVRTTSLKDSEAPELLAVLRFVRDTPGAEALGIAYAAAYLKAAAVEKIDAEPFDALGVMAERLARRATLRQGRADALSAHLEVAAHYGVHIASVERDGAITLCYDGEAFRRVLALPGAAAQRARAALALTRHDCVDPNLRPFERLQFDQWRAEVLDRVDVKQMAQLPEQTRNRLHLRRAGVWASLAYQQARRGGDTGAAAQRAVAEIGVIARDQLSDDDLVDYADAAMRVSASRWAGAVAAASKARLAVLTRPGQPGETCVLLVDARRDAEHPLARRCTWGIVWEGSASANAAGNALALAVQPLDTWRELWLFRQVAGEWTIEVMTPSVNVPGVGYVEFAGWVPGGERMLLAREAMDKGKPKRSFEVLQLANLATEKRASDAGLLALFRWQDAGWKAHSLSLR
jgi:hypothetical protein